MDGSDGEWRREWGWQEYIDEMFDYRWILCEFRGWNGVVKGYPFIDRSERDMRVITLQSDDMSAMLIGCGNRLMNILFMREL